MKKKNYEHYGSYRAPKTTQERRIYNEHKEYVRGKRSKRSLPNSHDDIHTSSWGLRKCWKVKRSKQYRVGGRGKKHVVYVENWIREWTITEFLEKQDIPFRILKKYETFPYTYINYWTGEEKTITSSRQIGFYITYWTNKKIVLPMHKLE